MTDPTRGIRRARRRGLAWAAVPLGLGAVALTGCPASDGGDAPDAGRGGEDDVPAAATAGVRGLGPLDALGRRFGRVRQRVHALGLTEEFGFRRVFVPEGGGTEIPLDLSTADCATFAALGGSGLSDLVLTLYDGDGREIAPDAVPGEGGLVHVCPQPGPDERPDLPVHLVVQAMEGSGAVVLGGFAGRPSDGRGFDEVFDGLLSPRVPVDGVGASLTRSLAPLRARGLEPVADPELETLAEGGVLRRSVQLDRGRCYVVLARGDRGIADLDLILFDPSGAEVARDLEGDAEPRLEHCPSEGGPHTLELRPYEGAGAVGWMMLSGPDRGDAVPPEAPSGGGAPDPAATGDQPDPVATLGATAATLAARGYDPPLFLVRGGFLAPGEIRPHEIVLGPGCAVVLGTAGDPGVDLDLYLAADDGRVVDRDTRVQPMARVGACPERARLFRVTVKSYGREGTYALATMRPPPAVTDLIGLRLEEATAAFRSRDFHAAGPAEGASARTVERVLAEGDRWTERRRLAPGSCAAVVAAGDEGVTDLDLLLRDPDGNVVASDAGPAPYAGVLRCHPAEAPRPELLEVEVVLYRGRGRVRRIGLERVDEPAASRRTDDREPPPEPTEDGDEAGAGARPTPGASPDDDPGAEDG